MGSRILTDIASVQEKLKENEMKKLQIINQHEVIKMDNIKSIFIKTFAMYVTFFIMGLSMPLYGMSLVHLEYLFSTTSEMLVLMFFLSSMGWTLGALFCGLFFEKSRNEVAFAVAGLFAGSALVSAGLSINVFMFLAFILVNGACFGFVDTATQPYCVRVWDGRKGKKPAMQGLHAIWSCGSALGPFIIRNFLVELNKNNDYIITSTNISSNATIDYVFSTEEIYSTVVGKSFDYSKGVFVNGNMSSEVLYYGNNSTPEYEGLTNVRYAWVILGVLVILSTLPYFVIVLCIRRQPRPSETSTVANESKPRMSWVRIVLLSLVFLYMYMFMNLEQLPANFYVSFAIKELGWSVAESANLMSLYFGSHLVGRIVGIPISKWVSPTKMLLFNSVIVTVAYFLLLLVRIFPPLLWVSTGISGLALATTFATVYIYISQLIVLSGAVSAVIMLGACLSNITSPAIVGLLMARRSPMWLIYSLVVFTSGQLIVLIILLLFAAKYKHKLDQK